MGQTVGLGSEGPGAAAVLRGNQGAGRPDRTRNPTVHIGPSSISGGSRPDTYFAPAGRATPGEIERTRRLLDDVGLARAMLDAMPTIVLVLNGQRQIVAANAALERAIRAPLADVIGKRPGEVFACIHVQEGPDGCGTAESCAYCGAVDAVLACRKRGEQLVREVRILRQASEGTAAMDFRITASEVEVAGESFVITALEDISDYKRLGVLTRVFFHDVMNTVTALKSFVRLLGRRRPSPASDSQHVECLRALTDQLADEIQAQRDLMLAESGDLEVDPQTVPVAGLVERIRAVYASDEVAKDRRIVVGRLWPGELTTDGRLLGRVLGNMLRNALEATPPGGAVTIHGTERGEAVAFEVHNEGVMSLDVQMQIFQRSFSTKDAVGRGIGTHSIKLLGERYLHGRVGFTSRPPEGTTFWIEVAKNWPGGA